MKRKAIFSILLITIFIVQISSLMTTEAQIDITDLKLEDDIQIPVIEKITDSMRTYVLHFESKSYYNNFVSAFTPKLEFPNLKMVAIDEWLSMKPILESIEGVDGVFDVTNADRHKITPPEDAGFTVISQDEVKKTITTKNIINLQPLWSLNYKGAGIRIMIVDSGINTAHVDFTGRIDFTDSKSFVYKIYGHDVDDPSIEDTDEHGTHCAGIAAGSGAGNPDYIGMAPQAEIVVARISQGGGASALPFIAAYEYALSLGDIDVVSCSWGGADQEGLEADELAIEELVKQGVVYTTSCGNSGPDYHTVDGSLNGISVAAIHNNGLLVDYSSRGPTADGHPKPDIAAPGFDIWSCGIGSSTAYASYGGTSMANPHIAGAAACLIDALQGLAIPYDAGLIKTALMKAANPGIYNYLQVGGGVANLGNSLNLIQTAATNGSGFPTILWAVPSMPISEFEIIPQGFHHDFYFQSVSSTPWEDLAPVVSGNITTIMTLNTTSWTELWTKNYFASINVADDATLGVYDGYVTFETAAGVNDTTYVKFEIIEGKAKLLMPKFYNDWGQDHILGQFIYPLLELLDQGVAVNEYSTWNITGEKNIITPELLAEYDAIFMSDIFDFSFDAALQPYHTRYLLASENLAIQQYIADGGGLFVVLNGQSFNYDYAITMGNNITMANELLNPYGIDVSDELFSFEDPVKIAPIGYHPLTDGVNYIDHYGTTLSVTGDTQILFKYEGEGTVAAYENSNGGRVVAVTTNFFMDTFGYLELYNDITQNAVFTMNVFNSLLAKEKILGNYTEDATGATFNIQSIDTSAVLSAEVKKTTPTGTSTSLVTLTAGGIPGAYTYRLDYTDDAIYKFSVTSADDLYTMTFLYDKTPPVVNTGGWVNNTVSESVRMEFAVVDALLPITSISVTLNGEFVTLSGSGKSRTFSILTTDFIDGDNILKIVATDQAGNKVDATYVIPTSTKGSPISTFAVLLGILSLASIVTAIKRKRK